MFKIEMFLNENKTEEKGKGSPEKIPYRISFQKYSISRGKTGRDFPKKYYPISPIFNFSVGTGRDFPKNTHPVSRISIFLAK